jgi:DNA replication and repair protein RecF
VQLRELWLKPFRNFVSQHIHLEAPHTLIFGPNGRGKSNILEAISYLSIAKSVRGAKDGQAVPHNGDFFDIRGSYSAGTAERTMRLFFGKKEGKKAFLDGNPLPRVADILGHFRTVHFSPEDVSLVLRFPAQRRRMLDILLSQSSPSYLRDLQTYQRVLQQRNVLLRTAKKAQSAAPSDKELAPWNEQMADLGARIRTARFEALDILRAPFSCFYARFSPAGEEATIHYRGLRANPEGMDPRQALLDELQRKRAQELQVGHTLCGPHRDDLAFDLDNQSAELYASEGQLKTILISWKLAECHYLVKQCDQQPVVLLDDVFSELDHNRIGVLLEVVREFNQVIITTPQEPDQKTAQQFEEIRLEK